MRVGWAVLWALAERHMPESRALPAPRPRRIDRREGGCLVSMVLSFIWSVPAGDEAGRGDERQRQLVDLVAGGGEQPGHLGALAVVQLHLPGDVLQVLAGEAVVGVVAL